MGEWGANGKLTDEGLRRDIVCPLKNAQIVREIWQITDTRIRPHSSLGCRPPVPVTFPALALRQPMVNTMPSPSQGSAKNTTELLTHPTSSGKNYFKTNNLTLQNVYLHKIIAM